MNSVLKNKGYDTGVVSASMKQTLFSWFSDKPRSILFVVREIHMNRFSNFYKVTLNFRSAAKKQIQIKFFILRV